MIAERKGVVVRRGPKKAWSKRTSRCTRTGLEAWLRSSHSFAVLRNVLEERLEGFLETTKHLDEYYTLLALGLMLPKRLLVWAAQHPKYSSRASDMKLLVFRASLPFNAQTGNWTAAPKYYSMR